MAYLLSGDYQSSRDFSFKMSPFLADRDLWQTEITDKDVTECEFAGAIGEAGDDIGPDLLGLFIENYEARVSSNKPDAGRSHSLMVCYLAQGSYETALDILDREPLLVSLADPDSAAAVHQAFAVPGQ